MEEYILHMPHDTLNLVKECVTAHIVNDEWFTVEALGNLMEVDLSVIFGNGKLGWSPTTLLHHCQVTETTVDAALSVPKPEELPIHRIGRTVRDRMEYLAGLERPTLKDWLNNSGIHNHALIVTGSEKYEKRRDAAVSESAEDDRKTTRLDGIDAFTYAIRALFERKDDPGFKNALDRIYGTAHDVASIDLEQMYPKKLENVKADEPNALFVTIETGMFEVTPESVEAVNSFISNAGEGRDIHLRII